MCMQNHNNGFYKLHMQIPVSDPLVDRVDGHAVDAIFYEEVVHMFHGG